MYPKNNSATLPHLNYKMVKILITISFILFKQVYSQGCCSSLASNTGIIEKQNLLISILYEYISIKDYLESISQISDPFQRKSSVNTFQTDLNYGINRYLSINLKTPFWVIRKKSLELKVSGTKINTQAKGIGDISFLSKISIIPLTVTSQRELYTGAGVVLPTGSYKEKDGDAILQTDMQPGTGAYSLIINSGILERFNFLPLDLSTNLNYQYNFSNPDGHRYGNEINGSIGLIWNRLFSIVDPGIQIYVRYSNTDKIASRILDGTGGFFSYVTPGINYRVTSQFSSFISGSVPLYRKVNETQTTPSYFLSFQLFYNLDFNKSSKTFGII